MSDNSGFTADIRPNGVATGADLATPAVSGTVDLIDVAAFTAYSQGVLHAVPASPDETITRGATSNIAKISSIQMTNAGAIVVVPGTDSADNTVNEVRDSAGGPPYIPVDSVELAQVRFTGDGAGDAAAITADEIKQVSGQHFELSSSPGLKVNTIGRGLGTTVAAEVNAHVRMSSALPLSHTGDTTKKIWAQYYTPTFVALDLSVDFVPAQNSHSSTSRQLYKETVATTSTTLGQSSFTFIPVDGVTDALINDADKILTFKFFPDENKTPFVLTQGKLGITTTYPADNLIEVAATISAGSPSANFSG